MGIAVGLGLGIPFGGGISTGAMRLASGEANVLAFDFADVGGPSALIRDTTTPGNNYNSSGRVVGGSLVGPGGKLTYTAPSPKLTLQSDGYYRYQAHNLYLNSATPANQSITVVSGATYAVVITGTVSTTASGAATGTWTAGTNTFTAATTTLTLGSTTGSGTVHVRRTPSVSDFVSTAGSIIYDLPYLWDSSGVAQGIRLEEARTNLLLRSSQFDSATWNKTNVSVTPNAAVAPDGTTTADLLTASGGTPTMYQGITGPGSASSVTFSIWLKSATGGSFTIAYYANGSGVDPNPTTGTLGTVTTEWQRLSVTYVAAASVGTINLTLGNYSTGWTAGNNVYAWGAQAELGATATSPIETFGSTVTRAVDNITLATSAFPWSSTAATIYAKFSGPTVDVERRAIQLDDGTANERLTLGSTAAAAGFLQVTDGGAAQTAPLTAGTVVADTAERLAASIAANDFKLLSDGGTDATDTSGTLPTVTTLRLGSGVSAADPLSGVIAAIMILPRTTTQAERQGYGA